MLSSPQRPSADQLREQIQEQVREQVDAAREAARDAREEARAAADEARASSEDLAPPGEPGMLVQPHGFDVIPPGAIELSIAFFIMIAVIVVGLPLARAFARRLDRRALPHANPEQAAQLQRIEQAVESIAIEVERISEGQRYAAKLLSDRQPEPAALPQRSKVP